MQQRSHRHHSVAGSLSGSGLIIANISVLVLMILALTVPSSLRHEERPIDQIVWD
jgi:hypothetical protein